LTGPASFRKFPVGVHETLEHRRDQLTKLIGPPGLLPEHTSVGNEIAMNFRGNFGRDPDGLLVRDWTELQFGHCQPFMRHMVPARGLG
jgi:hypothetical protein